MSYLRFEPLETKTKTFVWLVTSRDVPLGVVRWFCSWRRYCFYPEDSTIYDATCLREIADFCSDKTIQHKQRGGRSAATCRPDAGESKEGRIRRT